MKHFAHMLVILALVLSSVSPACAFISGKNSSLLEICTAEGLVYLSVDAQGNATPVKSEEPQNHTKKNDSCAFCFMHVSGKTLSAGFSYVLEAPRYPVEVFEDTDSVLYVSVSYIHAPRGPPSVLL